MNTSRFFEFLFNNAKENSIIITDVDGNILKVNEAFVNSFGYTTDSIEGKNFRVLFTDEDRKAGKPEKELQNVKMTGSSSDDNYLVDKTGNQVWVSGESVFINTNENETYIVKVIQNIHAQKQLERFVLESNEFLESIFESIKGSALIILDNMMKIIKVNSTFIEMFEMDEPLKEESRLTDINHVFWSDKELRKEIRNIIVANNSIKQKKIQLTTKAGVTKQVLLSAKVIHTEPTLERKVLVMVRED